jgi:hypothetical protein
MKTSTLILNACIILSAALLAGCDNSKSPSSSDEGSKPVMPKTQGALSTAADETKKAVAGAASTVAENAKATATDIASKFLDMAKAQGDNVLSSIGQDLAAKAKSLSDSSGGNESVKTNLDSSLTAMLNGKDTEALTPAFQVAQGINLTAPQIQLAKDVGNLASAFVVQRNFSSLSGAQGDVASLVSSLRNGEYAAALPPLQKIMSNASLTTPQKQLVGSLADKYAPSLKQAAGTLQQGIQTLQGLPGVKK